MTKHEKVNILLADDHLLVRKGLIKILEESYINALYGEASNSSQTMDLLREKEWDILILDLSMPGRSGFEIIKEIKDLYPKMPILVLSMYSVEQVAVRVIKAGVDGYLTKDSAVYELENAVKTILSGKKYIDVSVAGLLAAELSKNSVSDNLHDILSDREFHVFLMIASGKKLTEIAQELSLSVKTISTYRTNILQKLNFNTNSDLTSYAIQQKLLF